MQVRFLPGALRVRSSTVEQFPLKEAVVGSIPTGPTNLPAGRHTAGSANGRLADFESVYLGSNPSPAAYERYRCKNGHLISFKRSEIG